MKRKYIITSIIIFSAVVVAGIALVRQKNELAPNNTAKEQAETTKKPTGTMVQNSEYEELAFPDNTLDTSDWALYRNEEFGFEVRYPKNTINVSDKRVTEMKEMYEFGFYLDWHLGRVDIELPSEKNSLNIYVYDKDVNTMFELYSNSNKAPHDITGNIPVNNTQFFFLTSRDDTQPRDLSRYQNVYFAGDAERAYEIVLASIPLEQMKIFQKILSTFKLIK